MKTKIDLSEWEEMTRDESRALNLSDKHLEYWNGEEWISYEYGFRKGERKMKTEDKLKKFRKYLKSRNFNGAYAYLKKNIVIHFEETFKEELKK